MSSPETGADLSSNTDEDLAQRAQAGDRSALAHLIQRYKPIIGRLLQRFPIEDTERKNTFQDVCLHIVRNLHHYRHGERFSTWMYRVSSQIALSSMRAHRRRNVTSSDVIVTDSDESDASHPALSKRASVLEDALAQLPEEYRKTVMDHYAEGQSLRDVAERQQISESAVRSRLHRARLMLRRMLAAHGISTERISTTNDTSYAETYLSIPNGPEFNQPFREAWVQTFLDRQPSKQDLVAGSARLGISIAAIRAILYRARSRSSR